MSNPNLAYGNTWQVGASGTYDDKEKARIVDLLRRPLEVDGPRTEEELKVLRERVVQQLYNTGPSGASMLWEHIIPAYLSEDHAGAATCLALHLDKTAPNSVPLIALYYSWDLPGLTHKYCEVTLAIFVRTLSTEKSRDIAKRSLACMDRVNLDINDVSTIAEAYVSKLSVEELSAMLAPQINSDFAQFLKSSSNNTGGYLSSTLTTNVVGSTGGIASSGLLGATSQSATNINLTERMENE